MYGSSRPEVGDNCKVEFDGKGLCYIGGMKKHYASMPLTCDEDLAKHTDKARRSQMNDIGSRGTSSQAQVPLRVCTINLTGLTSSLEREIENARQRVRALPENGYCIDPEPALKYMMYDKGGLHTVLDAAEEDVHGLAHRL